MGADRVRRLELRRFVAPEFFLGAGAAELAGRCAANYHARKVLVVTDPGVARAGWSGVVERSLQEAGIPHSTFDGVSINPKAHDVTVGVELYRREGCDVIVAVGGGSPMDCAKAIGISSTNDAHILAFEGVDRIPMPGPPMIFVPTTAGTGADVSQFDIITDPERKVKAAIVSKVVIPDVSLIDPVTTTTMGAQLTAATGFDALTHAVEAYVSNASSPVTDLFALEAMRLVSCSLVEAVQQPENITAREAMMLASLYAGLAFSSASLGMVHAMAHGLGGLLDLPHGICNAILLEHVVEFNFEAAEQRYLDVARALGLEAGPLTGAEAKAALVRGLAAFRKRVGIRERLGDLGLDLKDIPLLAGHAQRDACMATNPRTATIEELRGCYERAF